MAIKVFEKKNKKKLNEDKISFDLWKETLRTITLSNWSRHIKNSHTI